MDQLPYPLITATVLIVSASSSTLIPTPASDLAHTIRRRNRRFNMLAAPEWNNIQMEWTGGVEGENCIIFLFLFLFEYCPPIRIQYTSRGRSSDSPTRVY